MSETTEVEELKNKILVGESVDLQKLVFLHVNRINIMLVDKPDFMPQAVKGLEIMLHPYKDEIYEDEIKDKKASYDEEMKGLKEKINRFSRSPNPNDNKKANGYRENLRTKRIEASLEKLSALVDLAERNNLYPEAGVMS